MSKSPDTLFFTLIPGGVSRRLAKLAFGGWRAFTLIEVLLVVAVIAILGGLGVAVVTNVQETSRFNKLSNDVAVINSAVEIYKASGGSFAESSTVDGVLTKLKTRSDATSSNQIAGFRGRMIDPRLMAEFQSSDEASSSQSRAIWNPATQRFEMVASGSAGVKRFLFDDAAGAVNYGTESRETANKLGTETDWVWDYEDGVASAPVAPVLPIVGSAAGSTAPVAPGTQQLSAPTFSPASGAFPIFDFPQQISLVNSNAGGVSQLWYDTGGGEVLYTGGSISVTSGSGISARARSIDPDRWTDSNPVSGDWQGVPFELSVALSSAPAAISYLEAGGSMPGAPAVEPAVAGVQITNLSEIPMGFRSSDQFQVFWTYDGSDPLTSGTAVSGGAFDGGIIPFDIDLSLARWAAGASSLQVRAAARSVNAAVFANSNVDSVNIEVSPTALAPPVIDPPSGSKAAEFPVSIALTGGFYPANARVHYTIDGADPGISGGEPAGGTLYTGSFNSGAGTDGVVVVNARAYGPENFGAWFTPSSPATNTYATITLASGALVGSANLNGTFVGSLVYASPPPGGTMGNITFNSNAQILRGNLFLPGTPTIRRTNGNIWSVANDNLFSSVILGWEFDSAGNRTVQTTPRVIDETGSALPNNYTVTFNNSALLEGKVVRRHDSPAFPTIPPPPPPQSNGSTSLNSPPAAPLNATQFSSVTINSSGVGDVRLNPGNFNSLIANNGTAFVLGDPLNPLVTQYYSFNSLTLNSSSDFKIVGKVVITVSSSINLNSGSVLGNQAHPEWLQLQFSSGSFTANSGSAVYGQLVAPTSNVTFNANSTFNGSVSARTLTINSNSVVFSLPPIIEN